MPRNLNDGTVLSSNTPTFEKKGVDSFHDYSIYKGVIITTYPVGSAQNRNGKSVEYDVQIVSGRQAGRILRHCRAINSFGGIVNFQEVVLQARTQAVRDNKVDESSKPENMDNSYVLVACLEGHYKDGMIVGYWPHPLNSDEGATTADGQRILGEFNGLRWNINKDGELIVTYNGGARNTKTRQAARASTSPTQIKIDKDGRFSILDNQNLLIKMDRVAKQIKLSCSDDESVLLDHTAHQIVINCGNNTKITMDKATKKTTIETAGDAKIIIDGTTNKVQIQANEIEVGDALLEYIVKATMLKTYVATAITTLFNAHIHNCGVGLTSIPTTTMTPPTEAQIASLKHRTE